MKRKSLALLCTLMAIVMAFPAFGLAADAGVVEITVWSAERHSQELLNQWVAEFNENNPDIHVTYELYAENYRQTLEIAANTSSLPDIVATNIEVLGERDLLMDLTPYLPENYREIYGDNFVEGGNMIDGTVVSLPNTGATQRLVYNKDIFERCGIENPPATLAEFVECAQIITETLSGEGIYGFALPMKSPSSGMARGIMQIPQLEGYPFQQGLDLTTGTYDFTPLKPVIEALTTIWDSGWAFPGCESLDMDPLRVQFADGKIGMYMTYSHSEWGVYTSQFPTEIEWGYAMLPTGDGAYPGSQSMTDDSSNWFSICSTTEHPEEAWRVYSWLYDIDNLIEYYEAGLGVSSVPAVIEQAKTPESIEYLPFMAIQPTDKVWPVSVSLSVEGDPWHDALAAIILGAQSIDKLDATIEDLNARYNAAYDKSIEDGVNERLVYPNFDAADPAGTMN